MANDGFTAKVHDALSDTMNLPAEFLSFLPQFIAQNPVPTVGDDAGKEIGYDQISSPVNIVGTTQATATTIIAGSEHEFDGSFVMAEFFSPTITTPSSGAGANVVICLFEGSTCIGLMAVVTTPASAIAEYCITAKLRFEPSAGLHTYSIKAFATSTTGTPSVQAGSAGSGNEVPAYLQFTKV